MSWSSESGRHAVDTLFQRRETPIEALLANTEAMAETCRVVAQRFQQGGKLVVFGNGGPSTDAQHIAVEFVHPVIVGKRALPAISLTSDVATVTGVASGEGLDEVFAHQVRCLADPVDIALGISTDGNCRNVERALEESRGLGMLTVALVGGDGGRIAARGFDHVLTAECDEPRVVKEVHVTMYHILWELVHVYLQQPAALSQSVAS